MVCVLDDALEEFLEGVSLGGILRGLLFDDVRCLAVEFTNGASIFTIRCSIDSLRLFRRQALLGERVRFGNRTDSQGCKMLTVFLLEVIETAENAQVIGLTLDEQRDFLHGSISGCSLKEYVWYIHGRWRVF